MTAPDPADTSPVRRIVHPLVARRLTVTDVRSLSTTLRRVVLDGPELEGFVAEGPTCHAKVMFPAEPGGEVVHAVVEDGRWVNRDAAGLTYRDYTVRTYTPGKGLVLEMLMHPHGPAGRWAAQASPGQELGVLGPRGSKIPPLDRERYLLAVDSTGIPALRNYLDRLPAGARVRAFVLVGGPHEEVPLPTAADLDVTWVHRGARPAGTTTFLQDAVVPALPGWLDGATPDQVWLFAAAEASAVKAIRAAATAAGLRGAFDTTGYWRLGIENFDHHSLEAEG